MTMSQHDSSPTIGQNERKRELMRYVFKLVSVFLCELV
uniref:Uncharacterized protein n=1 Tax=Rhizophora mucronata TaxID=61149 RepID=A0A2P2NUL6_RHIMU